jgi:HEAT repeat protein
MTSFREYVGELGVDVRPIKAGRLARLSHLTDEERREFADAWPGIGIQRRRQIVSRLVELAEDNVDLDFDAILLICLSDGDAAVRAEAIRGLWEYERHELIEPLIALLRSDGDPGVRAEAALALGRYVLQWEFGSLRDRYFQQVEEVLRQTLGNVREGSEVRARALEAIGACSLPWVRQAIQNAYHGDSRRLKVGAIHAMGRNCDPSWLPVLFEELSKTDPQMRYEAALACGSIAEEVAVPRLAPLLEDPDVEVRAAAIAALGEIGGPEAKSLLGRYAEHPSSDVRDAARDALSLVEFDEDPLSLSPEP